MTSGVDNKIDQPSNSTENEHATIEPAAEIDEYGDARRDVCDGTDSGAADAGNEADDASRGPKPRRATFVKWPWRRVVVYGVLPALVVMMAAGVGYLKWMEASGRLSHEAAVESVQAATESTIAMLGYDPDTVDKNLPAAADRMTGSFRDDYTKLIHDVVIPGAKGKRISAVATVPAAASVSASPRHAVVIVLVNQTTIVGNEPPTNSASSVQVTLDKVGVRWLISAFDPV